MTDKHPAPANPGFDAPLTVLLIGQAGDAHSDEAVRRLRALGYSVEPFLTGQDRTEKLPGRVLDWSGDLILHIRSYHILPESLLSRARIAAINLHPAPPRYRGAGGYNWALYNGDADYGVTAHVMDREIDHGPILKVYPLAIEPQDTLAALIARAHALQIDALADIAARIMAEPATAVDKMIAAYAGPSWSNRVHRISEIDALQAIPATASRDEIARVIRATRIGRFRPHLTLHGYTFILADD